MARNLFSILEGEEHWEAALPGQLQQCHCNCPSALALAPAHLEIFESVLQRPLLLFQRLCSLQGTLQPCEEKRQVIPYLPVSYTHLTLPTTPYV